MYNDMRSNTSGVARRTVLTHAGVVTAAVAVGSGQSSDAHCVP